MTEPTIVQDQLIGYANEIDQTLAQTADSISQLLARNQEARAILQRSRRTVGTAAKNKSLRDALDQYEAQLEQVENEINQLTANEDYLRLQALSRLLRFVWQNYRNYMLRLTWDGVFGSTWYRWTRYRGAKYATPSRRYISQARTAWGNAPGMPLFREATEDMVLLTQISAYVNTTVTRLVETVQRVKERQARIANQINAVKKLK